MKNFYATICGAILCVFLGQAFAASSSHKKEDTLEERIKPVGNVCLAGESCAAAPVQTAAVAEARSGQVVYDTKCSSCHATGAAGAPKFADVAAWAPRIDKGLETLVGHAINGFNGMPAKGLCFDCSDEEIESAVIYMTDGSK